MVVVGIQTHNPLLPDKDSEQMITSFLTTCHKKATDYDLVSFPTVPNLSQCSMKTRLLVNLIIYIFEHAL